MTFIRDGKRKINKTAFREKLPDEMYLYLEAFLYIYKIMLGSKAPTMMPTDCSVRCTPTILPIIRISWDSHPTFRLILGGGFQGLSSTYEQAHVDLDLLTLAS